MSSSSVSTPQSSHSSTPLRDSGPPANSKGSAPPPPAASPRNSTNSLATQPSGDRPIAPTTAITASGAVSHSPTLAPSVLPHAALAPHPSPLPFNEESKHPPLAGNTPADAPRPSPPLRRVAPVSSGSAIAPDPKVKLNATPAPPKVNPKPVGVTQLRPSSQSAPNMQRLMTRVPRGMTGGAPAAGYSSEFPPSMYMSLQVTPYQSGTGSDSTSLVILIPPLTNYVIRGLFYHPSFRSVTANIVMQMGASSPSPRRFLINPQLVRNMIAKNAAALKNLSPTTAGYLAAGIVCDIPLYIVFTPAPTTLNGKRIPSSLSVTNLHSNESKFIDSIKSSTVRPPPGPSAREIQAQRNAKAFAATVAKGCDRVPPANSVDPNALGGQPPGPTNDPLTGLEDDAALKTLIDEIMGPGHSLMESDTPQGTGKDTALEEIDTSFWDEFNSNSDEMMGDHPPPAPSPFPPGALPTKPTTSPLSEGALVSNKPSAFVSKVAASALPTQNYSPLKKIDLSGTVKSSLSQKPGLADARAKTLGASAPSLPTPPGISAAGGKPTPSAKSPKKRTKKRNTTAEWSLLDKATFKKAVIRYGTSFGPIAACVSTKTSTQVKNYYHENGGAKGPFKSLLREHHYLKRCERLDAYDPTLTEEEKQEALKNEGNISIPLSYLHDNSARKRKRPPGFNTAPMKRSKTESNLPVVEAADPTSGMTPERRQQYILSKAEAILASNERREFTCKSLEDHPFPSAPASEVVKQNLTRIVQVDHSLIISTEASRKQAELARKGEDEETVLSYNGPFSLCLPLPAASNDLQQYYSITYERVANAARGKALCRDSLRHSSSYMDDGEISSVPGSPSGSHHHNHSDIIPPLAFDLALSSGLGEYSSWNHEPSSSSQFTPFSNKSHLQSASSFSLHASAPSLPSGNFRPPPAKKDTIFGKQALFNFSTAASVFMSGEVSQTSLSPALITVPRSLIRSKPVGVTESTGLSAKIFEREKVPYDSLDRLASLWKMSPSQSIQVTRSLYQHYDMFQQGAKEDERFLATPLPGVASAAAYLNEQHILTQVHNSPEATELLVYSTSFFDGHILRPLQSQSFNLLHTSSSLNHSLPLADDNTHLLMELCDGAQMLAVAVQNTIVLYDLASAFTHSLTCVKELQQHPGVVTGLVASPRHANFLASCDDRGCVRIWDLTRSSHSIPSKDAPAQELKDASHSEDLRLLWSSSGSWLAIYDEKSVTLMACQSTNSNMRTKKVNNGRFTINCPAEQTISSLCFSPVETRSLSGDVMERADNAALLIATHEGTIFLYDLCQERKAPLQVVSQTHYLAMTMIRCCDSSLLFALAAPGEQERESDHVIQFHLYLYGDNPSQPLQFLRHVPIKLSQGEFLPSTSDNNPYSLQDAEQLLTCESEKVALALSKRKVDGVRQQVLVSLLPDSLQALLYPGISLPSKSHLKEI